MLARHGFLYKRSPNGAHQRRAAPNSPAGLVTSVVQPNTPSVASPSITSDPKTTEPLTVVTPVLPTTQTTATPASSSATPSVSTPAASSNSASAPTSASTPSTSASSSHASTAASTPSTSLALGSTPTTHALSATNPVVSTGVYTLTSSLVPSSTSTPGSSGGTNTGAIVGGIAGTLAGIAVLGFLLMWCMRRQRNRDLDDFDAQAFKRQSAVLLDDPVEPPRSYNPRPPTMIEHHNASPALAAQAGSGGQNFYGDYGGYSQPEVIQPMGSPAPQAYGAQAMGYTGYNDPQQSLARQPSNAAYLTRQPSSAVGYAPPTAPPGAFDPSAHYIDLNRSSISPYQAAQYADISRQLGTTNPSAPVHHESSDLPDGPLPSPFDDPAKAAPRPGASHPSNAAMPGPVTITSAPQTQGNATVAHQRPATVYEEGDAYGGI